VTPLDRHAAFPPAIPAKRSVATFMAGINIPGRAWSRPSPMRLQPSMIMPADSTRESTRGALGELVLHEAEYRAELKTMQDPFQGDVRRHGCPIEMEKPGDAARSRNAAHAQPVAESWECPPLSRTLINHARWLGFSPLRKSPVTPLAPTWTRPLGQLRSVVVTWERT